MEDYLPSLGLGGLNMKSNREIKDSIFFILSWTCFLGESKWSHMFRIRYFAYGQPKHRYFQYSVWTSIRDHINSVISNSVWIIGMG